LKLEELNQLEEAQFLERIGGPLEGETWLAAQVITSRPFDDVEGLITAFEQAIDSASTDEKVKLIASHPDLAGTLDRALSAASVQEQAAAGLNHLTPDEHAEFSALNNAYRARFGFPFVICARENTKDSILTQFRQRLEQSREQEIETGAAQVFRILRLRLLDLIEA
jgi:OHCU decarboxylase